MPLPPLPGPGADSARHRVDDGGSGRHRRPESLADLRSDAHPADDAIRAARQAAEELRAGAPRPVPPPPPRSHLIGPSRVERRRLERQATRRSPASPGTGGRHTAPRGRHVRPADPFDIQVRAAAAGPPGPGGRRPVIGARRAPGTLPIESWLLVGRTRQQALLASLVAAGLALVMIPGAQPDEVVEPVTAAGTTATRTDPATPPKAAKPATKKPVEQSRKTDKDQPPPTSAPAAPPPASKPAVTTGPATPPADGPSRSLRTTGTSTVALTFDDGPDPVQTPKILAMLRKYDVRATFCVVGVQVERHPEIVREIAAAGHTLCNHTWDHSLTIGKDEPADIDADLERTNQAIRAAVPDAAIPFFRAPGGNFSDRLVQVARDKGMTSLYWEVDPRDWEHDEDSGDESHVDKVVEDVRSAVRPGSIVLSHDFNQPDTIIAYERLLPWLAENFELGTPPADAPA